MAKTSYVLKQLQALNAGEPEREGNKYSLFVGQHLVEFRDEDGRASLLHIRRAEDEPDLMTDYFPGWWPNTVKAAVNSLLDHSTLILKPCEACGNDEVDYHWDVAEGRADYTCRKCGNTKADWLPKDAEDHRADSEKRYAEMDKITENIPAGLPPVGALVYYTGDVANLSWWGRVISASVSKYGVYSHVRDEEGKLHLALFPQGFANHALNRNSEPMHLDQLLRSWRSFRFGWIHEEEAPASLAASIPETPTIGPTCEDGAASLFC